MPHRIKYLEKTIVSLLNQKKKPDKIFINIPNKYKRFKETIENNQIPKFDDNIIEITRCEDFGPGTKLLGSLSKIKKNSLLILADDDHNYADYMVEKFFYFYSRAPNNAYSFYVHPLGSFGIGQGADGFAINSDVLDGVKEFYNKVVITNKDLFIHDDLWISFFLFYVKKIKILSLQPHLKKTTENKTSPIYTKHTQDNGLIESYGENINEAVRKRDEIASESLKYMFNKISQMKF